MCSVTGSQFAPDGGRGEGRGSGVRGGKCKGDVACCSLLGNFVRGID